MHDRLVTAVAIYARYSTDRQDARSIDDQLRRCGRYATEHGMQVVEQFSDAAVSGATTARDGLHRLLAAARARRFQLVLVDDLSRLSRDLGDLFRLVFDDFLAVGIVLLDCQTGMRSDQAGARMTFGAVGLASDAFLQMIKHETHRGLEGRAINGFHTGGRCYGYATVAEQNPADPLHPRAVVVKHADEAQRVAWMFEAFDGGASPREIAAQLNRAGVPAPYDGRGYRKQAGAGWGHSTIRAMLRNERYIGRFVWNRRQWNRVGAQKRRVPRLRPDAELVVSDRPELSIVPRELWDRVQERLAHRKHVAGVPKTRTGAKPSPLSGLLRCGTCGSRMALCGQKKKGDVVYRSFKCSANGSKGAEICPNDTTISENKALAALVATVRESLDHPGFQDRVAETFEKLWAEAQREASRSDEGARLAGEIAAVEAKVGRLMRLVEDGNGDVEALVARIRVLETQARELRGRRAAQSGQPAAAGLAGRPDIGQLWRSVLEDVPRALMADPARARQMLETHFEPVVLTPRQTPDGATYGLETKLKMLPAAIAGGRKVCSMVGCGGRI